MQVEILYPSFANLYGEATAVRYLTQCLPEAEIIRTELGQIPAFVKEKVDMVYMGGMTEDQQELVIRELQPYKARIEELIEQNTVFLMVSNALEIFGRYIQKEDGTEIEALGLFETYAKRNMTMRYNSLVLGQMEGFKLLGYKSQFSHSYGDNTNEFLFETERGAGINPESKLEGLRRRNFMATYLLGPLLVLNPAFMRYLLGLLGIKECRLPYEDTMQEAFNRRLAEFEDQNTRY